MIKSYQGVDYEYNPQTKKYLNPFTNKWVVKPRTAKGKNLTVSTDASQNDKYIQFDIFPFDAATNERINFFLTKIQERCNKFKRGVYFPCKHLIYILGYNYMNIINYLIENKIIKRDVFKVNRYGHNIYYYTLLLNPCYNYKYITIDKVQKAITNYYMLVKNGFGDLLPIVEQMFKIRINITAREFLIGIKQCYYQKKRKITLKEYINDSKKYYTLIQRWNAAKNIERYSFFTLDGFGGRLHHPFTQIPKFVRKNHINYNCSLDMVAAQPTLFADLVKKQYCECFPVDKFVQDVENGDIYVTIQNKLRLKSRDAAKQFMNIILFDDDGVNVAKATYKFRQMYPFAASLLSDMKFNNYKNSARELQKKEVDLFSQVWKELKQRNIDFITIHDEIVFDKKDMQVVKAVMNRIFTKNLDVNFKLK